MGPQKTVFGQKKKVSRYSHLYRSPHSILAKMIRRPKGGFVHPTPTSTQLGKFIFEKFSLSVEQVTLNELENHLNSLMNERQP